MSRRRVAYFYDGTPYTENIGNFYYGQGHPMKPHRVRMTHQLILNYNLYRLMDVYVSSTQRPHYASAEELTYFHNPDHIKYLQHAEVSGVKVFTHHERAREDCPVFENMFEFFQICAGASIDCAAAINHGVADICINWAGGFHHAKKNEASGFCYINDIVLAILELLKYHERVLYIDIDAHHGDGVEEAFYTTNRVMTVSFHKFGNFFPGTGDIKDCGTGEGRYHSLNIPLKSGMTDECYEHIFKPIMREVMYHYQPNAIVCQCGSDSLAHDKLGKFNLTTRGHGDCVTFMKTFGLPMIVLGGGGYTVSNVSRCWAYETSLCLDQEVSNDIPANDYYQYYGPSYKLHIEPDRALENRNSREYLETCVIRCLESIRMLEGAPSVQKHDILPDFFPPEFQEQLQQGKQSESEFYD
jgi:histone deacetylase 1/2